MLRCVHKLAVLVCVAIAIVVQGCGGTTHLALNGPERAALEKASLEKKPVFVGFIATTAPDSKGAVGARAQLYNTSDKPYKHVDLLVVGYDVTGVSRSRSRATSASSDCASRDLCSRTGR